MPLTHVPLQHQDIVSAVTTAADIFAFSAPLRLGVLLNAAHSPFVRHGSSPSAAGHGRHAHASAVIDPRDVRVLVYPRCNAGVQELAALTLSAPRCGWASSPRPSALTHELLPDAHPGTPTTPLSTFRSSPHDVPSLRGYHLSCIWPSHDVPSLRGYHLSCICYQGARVPPRGHCFWQRLIDVSSKGGGCCSAIFPWTPLAILPP